MDTAITRCPKKKTVNTQGRKGETGTGDVKPLFIKEGAVTASKRHRQMGQQEDRNPGLTFCKSVYVNSSN